MSRLSPEKENQLNIILTIYNTPIVEQQQHPGWKEMQVSVETRALKQTLLW